jgi:hypothetical protein
MLCTPRTPVSLLQSLRKSRPSPAGAPRCALFARSAAPTAFWTGPAHGGRSS